MRAPSTGLLIVCEDDPLAILAASADGSLDEKLQIRHRSLPYRA
jgi:hypothetical protein